MDMARIKSKVRRKVTEKGLRVGCRLAAKALQRFDEPVASEPSESFTTSEPTKQPWKQINQDLYDSGRHAPIEGAPEVELERPVVMVPGFRSRGDSFFNWANTLTQDGRNGGHWYLMEDDAVFDSRRLNEPVLFADSQAKVFVTRFEGNVETPDEAGRKLGGYLETVTESTGQEKADVAAFSMGGLISRSHLDQSEEPRIGKLLQLGTPNQGSELGRVATIYLEERPQELESPTKFEQYKIAPRDLDAARWLRPAGPENPELEALNSRWSEQRERLEDFRVVGSDAKRTLSPGLGLSRGDGKVHTESLALPGETPVLLDPSLKLDHKDLVIAPEGFQQAQEFLGWQIADSPTPSTPAPPPTKAPAQTYQQTRLF